ncbi:hypothetical protein ACLOJK_007096 [Asimina triloba]
MALHMRQLGGGPTRDLEERVRLIDRCSSKEDYRYHVFQEFPSTMLRQHHVRDLFGVNSIMEVEEYPEEIMFIQVVKDVLRSDAPPKGLYHNHHYEGSTEGGGGIVGPTGVALVREDGRGGAMFLWAEALQEWVEGVMAELFAERDMVRLMRDEMVEDAEDAMGANQGLEHTLTEADVEKVVELSAELKAARVEVARLCERVVGLSERKTDLLAELEASQAKVV